MHRLLLVAVLVALTVGFSVTLLPTDAATSVGHRTFQYGASCNSTPTGEKPESKLWWNDGFWWGSLCTPNNENHIYRFNLANHQWVDTGTPIDSRPSAKADVLWNGQKLYIASHVFSNNASSTTAQSQWARLYRYSYNASNKTYQLDSGFPVLINRGPAETQVIDRAPSGRLWIAYVQDRKVMVNYSVGNDATWGTPFALPVSGASDLSSDDIASLIVFDRTTTQAKIGVLWSNQQTQRMYFAVHLDEASPNEWSVASLPIATNSLAADDHINIKLQSDGKGIYAVTKTSNTQPNDPLILLLSCRNNCQFMGNWSITPVYRVADEHTRPIVLLDITNRKVNVFTSTPETGGSIHRAVYAMDTLSASSQAESKGVVMQNDLDVRLNNPTSTKQTVNHSTGMLVLASDQQTRYYVHSYISLGDSQAPSPTPVPDGVQMRRILLPMVRTPSR